MVGLGSLGETWRAVTTDDRHCPDCGATLERGYQRDPAAQEHWRGVEADICEDCGYAERVA